VLVTALVLVGTLAWRALRRHLSAAADPLVRGQVLFACGALMQMGLHAINDFPMRSQSLACLAVWRSRSFCRSGGRSRLLPMMPHRPKTTARPPRPRPIRCRHDGRVRRGLIAA
jgi:hypothetical protein